MSADHVTEAPSLGEATLAELRGSLRGKLVLPADPGYDEARSVWNGMIDRRPAAVARCAGAADVVAAIGFARSEGLTVAVRGGGHNVAGDGTCDGGLVIDLSPMRAVSVDPDRRVVRVQGGATWSVVDAETQAFGLATTGGLVSTTGVGGFTLGGGIGWLMRKHGLACDNLVGAELITADGRSVTVSKEETPELLWGLRGGGGNFGVVTEFAFRLHQVGPVLGGMVGWRMERAAEVLRLWRDWAREAPDEVNTLAILAYGPPEEFVPADLQGAPMVAIAACHLDANGGEEMLRELRALGPPAFDVIAPMPYVAVQSMADAGAPRGLRNYWRSVFLDELGDAALDALLASAESIPAPFGQIHVHQLGGAVGRVAPEDTAYGERDAAYVLNLVGTWEAGGEDDRNREWVRNASDAVAPYTSGRTYVNFLADEGVDGVRAAYEPPALTRLRELKREYDPTNFLRLNQNIDPAG